MKTLYRIALLAIVILPASLFAQPDGGGNNSGGARAEGIALYNKGSYKESAAVLEKVVQTTPNDTEAQTFLALSQLRLGKIKDAEKTLEKTLKIDPNQPNARKSLAYVTLLRGKLKESLKQIEALKALGVMDAESFYIAGMAYLRLDNSEAALEHADRAIRLNPNYANAYLLKAHSIMNRWDSPKDYKAIAAKYGSSADNIGKFVTLSATQPTDASFWRGQERTLRIFADYYNAREKNKPADEASENVTPIRILTKPRAAYTDQARQKMVEGTIRLLVAFPPDGVVKDVVILTSLGYGLDAEAVRAARGIKYAPETRDGKPVMTVKTVEYTFSIY